MAKKMLRLKKGQQLFWGEGKDIGFGFFDKVIVADDNEEIDMKDIGSAMFPFGLKKGEKYASVMNPHNMVDASFVPLDKLRTELHNKDTCKSTGGKWDSKSKSCSFPKK